MAMIKKINTLSARIAVQGNHSNVLQRKIEALIAEQGRVEANKAANAAEKARVQQLNQEYKDLMESVSELTRKAGQVEASAMTRQNKEPNQVAPTVAQRLGFA